MSQQPFDPASATSEQVPFEEEMLENALNDAEDALMCELDYPQVDTAKLKDVSEEEFQVVYTPPTAVRSAPRDFEVFAYAKLGNADMCLKFAKTQRISLQFFIDNKLRNILHYAADSGNEPLVKRLQAYSPTIPTVTDELGMTPADVAFINGYDDAFVALLGKPTHDSRDAALQHYRKPSQFVISRPAPKAVAGAGRRGFWGGAAAPSSASSSPASWSCRIDRGGELPTNEAREALAREAYAHYLYLREKNEKAQKENPSPNEEAPPSVPYFSQVALEERAMRLTVVTATSKDGAVVGQLLAWDPIEEISPVLHVGALQVDPAFHHQGVAAALMKSLKAALVTYAHCQYVAFFVPQRPLLTPPTPASFIRTYRRSLQPIKPLGRPAGMWLYPDFFFTECSLRADFVVRESLVSSVRQPLEHLVATEWSVVDPDNAAQVELVRKFLETQREHLCASKKQMLTIAPTEIEIRHHLLPHHDHWTCVRYTDEVVTDVISFRRCQKEASEELVVVEVSFASFSTLCPGPERMQLLMVVGAQLVHADTVLVPEMWGFESQELVKAQFVECVNLRKFLYVIDVNTQETMKEAVVPSKQLSIPVAF